MDEGVKGDVAVESRRLFSTAKLKNTEESN
jgi:hypothetical protein